MSQKQQGVVVPSYSYANQVQQPRLDATLKSSAAWNWLPAAAMAVSLGVTLNIAQPTHAEAQVQTLNDSTTTVNLANYPGYTSFDVPSATTIDTTASSGDAIYGASGSTWTLSNEGIVEGHVNGIDFQSAGTVTNTGQITGATADGVSLAAGGSVTNSGTASSISAYRYGVRITGGSGTVTNEGTITGAEYGVRLLAGGSVTNSGTASLISGYSGVQILGGAGTITNEGTITAPNLYGIRLLAGGSVTNSGVTSSISGDQIGVVIQGGVGSVTNEGTIAGTYRYGVRLTGGGSVTNSGTASLIGGYSGIQILGAGTVINEGTIAGSYLYGVRLRGGGSVVNSGAASSISGHYSGVYVRGGSGTVTNEGMITSTIQAGVSFIDTLGTFNNTVINRGTISGGNGIAVQFGAGSDLLEIGAGASFTGSAQGGAGSDEIEFISGANSTFSNFAGFETAAVDAGATWTTSATLTDVAVTDAGSLFNTGTVANSTGSAVTLTGSGYLSNAGAITGHTDGVYGSGGTQTVVNTGTITGTTLYGVILYAGGSVTNSGTASSISGDYGGVYIGGAGTVANEGAISGTNDYGVDLEAGGSVTNSGTASLISGGVTGVNVDSGLGTVTNEGAITGTNGYGVLLNVGGSVTNSGTASSISGGYDGVYIAGGTGTVTNDGAIAGTSNYGVRLAGGGVVTNRGAASSISGYGGVSISGGPGIVTNAGTITGTGGAGVVFGDALGTFNNTLINSGTIVGNNGTAVQFGAGDDRLVLNAGFAFSGVVEAGAGDDTLEFASGNANLADIGTEFVDFETAQVDSGATLSLSGPTTIASGFTFDNQGTLDNSQTLTIDGVFTNSGTIDNTGTITGGFTNTGTLDNGGVITGNPYGVTGGGAITNSGTIHGTVAGVNFNAAGTLTNTGLISGDTYGLIASAGTVINSGTIQDAGTAGVSLGSGANVQNQTGGLITGVTGAVFTGTGATLTNNGTITGTGGVAVQFDAGANTFTIGTGSVLNGSVDGGAGAGVINFAGTGVITNTIGNFGAGSAINIASGANWTATGNWAAANVVNAGTLQPGTLTTPLKVTGNFAQTSAGVLQVALDANGTGSQLQVSGGAALDGSVAVMPSGTFATGDKKYTILTATGGVTGTFTGVTGGTLLLTPTLSYDAKDAFVTLTQQDVSGGGTGGSGTGGGTGGSGTGGGTPPPPSFTETPNEFAAASAFDSGRAADTAKFADALHALDTFTDADGLRSAIDKITGENNADLSTLALYAGRQFVNQFQQHSLLTRADGKAWDIWGSAFTQNGDIDGNGNAHRLREGVEGGAGGIDYRVLPTLRVGVAFGYGSGHLRLSGNNGRASVNTTEAAVTGDYTDGLFYADALLGGAWGSGHTHRDVSLPGLPAIVSGRVSDSQFLTSFEAGYTVVQEAVDVTPFAALNIGAVNERGFTEDGGAALDLQAAGKSTTATQSVIGTRVTGDIPFDQLALKVDAKLGWAHEFSTGRSVTQSFAGTPGTSFAIQGASLPGDSAVVGLGVSATVFPGASAYVHYDGELSGNASSHAFTAGFRFGW